MAEPEVKQAQEPETKEQNVSEVDTKGTNEQSKDEPVTMESLMVQIKELRADNAKLQNKSDQMASENGTLRKQLREKMTAEEQEAEAKAEREAQEQAENDAIRKELEILKGTNQYLEMGFDKELAEDTATAAFEHNQERVNANFAKWQAAKEKAMEARLRQELLKDMPAPNSGNSTDVDYTKQKNDALANGDTKGYASAVLAEARQNGFGAK